MADQHARAGHVSGDDLGEVVAEPVDRAVLGARSLGAAVGALVPQDHAVVVTQVFALVVPRLHAEAVAVAEDDGQRRLVVGRRVLPLRAIDLDVQRLAVGGDERVLGAAQLAERLAGLGVGAQPDAADRVPLGQRRRRDAC
ncbi:hypothetical protein GCM10020001_057540 [Nonomuraea salmonea]